MEATSVVTATCSVQTVFDAKVTWLMDGRAAPRPAVTDPSVEIRRSLPDLRKRNSVVLICDVTQLSSSDLYITFQANDVDISEKLYVDLPESTEPHSVSRKFSVPSNYQKKEKSFTCTVNQGFSRTFKSQSTGNIFVDPSVELLVVPSEASGPQRLSCSGSGFNPHIQWFSESQQRSSSTNDVIADAEGRVTVTNQLQVPQTEWKTGKVFSCEVSDRSLGTKVKKDISFCSGPAVTDPSVEIRRSLPDLRKRNSVVLICDVTQLSSSDLYITFQANDVDISEKLYVDLPESTEPHSVSRKFSVPSNYQKKDKSFTCTVNQGFSRTFKSQSTGNIFVDPSVELLVVPNEASGPQRLSCSGSGFNPHIQWFIESQQRSSSTNDVIADADGRVTVTSQLQVPQTEWTTGKVFSCEVSDRSLGTKVKKDISISSAPVFGNGKNPCPNQGYDDHSSKKRDPITVTLKPPSPTELFTNNQTVLECLVTGQDRAAVDEIQVTWQIDGQTTTSTSGPTKTEGSRYSKASTLALIHTEWEGVNKVSCSAVGQDMRPTIRELVVNKGDGSKVTVHVLPEDHMRNSAEVTLVCLVSSPVLQDYYIACQHSKAGTLTRSRTEWETVNKVSCSAVRQDVTLTVRELIVNKGDGSEPKVTVHVLPEDDMRNSAEVTLVCLVSSPVLQDYYIACNHENSHCDDYFDYWGKGTTVTVTSATTTGPSVFPLIQCGSGTGNLFTLGCLATGFTPSSLTFKWTKDGTPLTDFIQYPPVRKGSEYTGVSQIQVSRQDWNNGQRFKCLVEHPGGNSQTPHIVKKRERLVSPNITLHPAWENGFWATPVRLICTLSGFFPDKWDVAWKQDNRPLTTRETKEKLRSVVGEEETFSLSSEIKPNMREWEKGSDFTCNSKPTSDLTKTISICERPAVTDPSVEIRRSLPDLRKRNSVVLICDVTQLSSSDLYITFQANDVDISEKLDLYITFQANDVDISEKLYVDLPESTEPHSVSRKFSVPSNYQKKDKNFTCTVNQGFSRKFKSQSTGNIFVDPSVELLVVPSEASGPQRLSCSGSGFNPHIQWFSESQQRSSSTNDVIADADGRVTVTNQLQVPQTEWTTGKVFSCEVSDRSLGTKVKKDISFCSVHAATPPSIHVETPSFKTVMEATSVVTATCSVQTVFDAKVTWLMDGGAAPRPAVTDPSVEIRRSLPDLRKRNSVVLICDVTQLSSSDLYITFQANDVDISEKLYVDLPESTEPHSVSRKFSVPSNYQKKDKSFTCTVNQGFSRKFKSQSTGNIFVDPSVELLVVPNEASGPQRLSCSGSGFNPHIQWFIESQQRSSSTNDVIADADGRVTVTSQLQVTQTEWKTDKIFSCEVSDRSLDKTIRKNISHFSASVSCEGKHPCSNLGYEDHMAPVRVTLNPPSPRKMFNNKEAVLECVITGQNKTIVDEIMIRWQVDGQSVSGTLEPTQSDGRQHRKTSTLTRNHTEWVKVTKVRCSAAREDMIPVIQELVVNKADGNDAKVTVHILTEENMNNPAEVTLMCLVSSAVEQDYYITWSEDEGKANGNYVDGINFPPRKIQSQYLVTSVYTTSREKWDQYKTFNCNVWPAGKNEAMEPHGVSAAIGVNRDHNPSCDWSFTDDKGEEDEFSSLWSTASSFIFLFIFSFFYSMIFSLAKMKKS
ncbi:hypothetical protein Q5P01_017491 [Channa striata]|uniref:Ig-like domain-containing protein n=1 Tax=Channa striata TaxID=64152 RepID=A0AA88SHD3_CHASR|nr:hypothetical protein Q5P01_017491 [Channa striata]